MTAARADPHAWFDRAWRGVTEQYTAVKRDQAAMFNADVFLCEDVLVNSPGKPGTYSILAAMGPAFCSELVLLKW